MTYSLDITLPGLPPMNTADGLSRWKRKKIKDEWEGAVMLYARPKPSKPLARARVTITRFSGPREPDFDNLTQGGKFLMDGLVRAGIIEDDCPRVVGQPTYYWEKAKRGEGRVRIQVHGGSGVDLGPSVPVGEVGDG